MDVNLLLALPVFAALAGAPSPPAGKAEVAVLQAQDLVGSWELDLAASEPVEALMEAGGFGWVERNALAKLPITQVFSLEGDVLEVLIDTPLGDRTERLPLGGEVKTGTSPKGEPWESRTRFDGDALASTMRVTLAEGTRTFTIRRTLHEDRTVLRQTLVLTLPDGRVLQAKRLFRKVKA